MLTNNNSHLTAKKRDKLSFPMRWLYQKGYLKGKILDFGCGLGTDVAFLLQNGLDITGYDKFYFPKLQPIKYNTIVCSYVLNVLMPDEQPEIFFKVSELMKKGGKAYFIVRRDVKHPGFRIHKLHKKPTYQCNVVLPFKSIFKNDFCEIYEFRHFNELESNSKCPFCNLSEDANIITEIVNAYAILDKYPVSKGHCLIIPKRHKNSFFDLTKKEQCACQIVIRHVKDLLDKQYRPDGYNLGVNINRSAGQTIDHVHIHLIPRYNGDVDDPVGGVRNVIPGKGNYLIK